MVWIKVNYALFLHGIELFLNKAICVYPANVSYALTEESFPVISLFVGYHL